MAACGACIRSWRQRKSREIPRKADREAREWREEWKGCGAGKRETVDETEVDREGTERQGEKKRAEDIGQVEYL